MVQAGISSDEGESSQKIWRGFYTRKESGGMRRLIFQRS